MAYGAVSENVNDVIKFVFKSLAGDKSCIYYLNYVDLKYVKFVNAEPVHSEEVRSFYVMDRHLYHLEKNLRHYALDYKKYINEKLVEDVKL